MKTLILAIILVVGSVTSSYAVCGMASHYGRGDGFHGRRTASGQVMNAHAMTAAHCRIPFHTHLTVTNPRNGRSVNVIVNDRGPAAWTGKIIDLSYAAARAIGITGVGRVCF